MEGWERVYYSNQAHTIEIVKAALEDHEIKSVVLDKRITSYVSVGDIEVYVPAEDAILAKIIIEQLAL